MCTEGDGHVARGELGRVDDIGGVAGRGQRRARWPRRRRAARAWCAWRSHAATTPSICADSSAWSAGRIERMPGLVGSLPRSATSSASASAVKVCRFFTRALPPRSQKETYPSAHGRVTVVSPVSAPRRLPRYLRSASRRRVPSGSASSGSCMLSVSTSWGIPLADAGDVPQWRASPPVFCIGTCGSEHEGAPGRGPPVTFVPVPSGHAGQVGCQRQCRPGTGQADGVDARPEWPRGARPCTAGSGEATTSTPDPGSRRSKTERTGASPHRARQRTLRPSVGFECGRVSSEVGEGRGRPDATARR